MQRREDRGVRIHNQDNFFEPFFNPFVRKARQKTVDAVLPDAAAEMNFVPFRHGSCSISNGFMQSRQGIILIEDWLLGVRYAIAVLAKWSLPGQARIGASRSILNGSRIDHTIPPADTRPFINAVTHRKPRSKPNAVSAKTPSLRDPITVTNVFRYWRDFALATTSELCSRARVGGGERHSRLQTNSLPFRKDSSDASRGTVVSLFGVLNPH